MIDPRRSMRLLLRLNAPCGWAAAVLTLLMMLSVVYDVSARLFFRAPTIWVIDLNEYALVYLTFVPAAWILLRDGHIKVELLYQRLGPRAQLRMRAATDLLGLLYCVVLAWQSWLVAWDAYEGGYRFSTALALPQFPVLVIIPLGAVWLAMAFVVRLWAGARGALPPPGGE